MSKAQYLAARALDLADQCLENCTDDLVARSAGDHEAIIHAGYILRLGDPDEPGAERLVDQLALTLLSATFEEIVNHNRAQDIA
jgi:hypothetical protein